MEYNFEWDPVKARANFRKHGIGFERATEIFRDPLMVSIFDDEHSQMEDRWITIGKDYNEMHLVVIHSFKDIDASNSRIRIISARKATKKEIKQYSIR